MKKRYEWRGLANNGMLQKAELGGPYYARDDSLRMGSWDTEDEAVTAYEEFYKKYDFYTKELVLICIYSAMPNVPHEPPPKAVGRSEAE